MTNSAAKYRVGLSLVWAAACAAGVGLSGGSWTVANGAEEWWTKDFEAAKARATGEKKDVLVLFVANWSGPCRRLQERVFAQRDFQQAVSRHFVVVRLENRGSDADPGMGQLMKHWSASAVPTVVLADAQGRGYARSSGYNADSPYHFLAQLDWRRQTRVRRDELFAEAGRTAGSRRAVRLDRALSLVHPALAAVDYKEWIADIMSWEGEQAAELQTKYKELGKVPERLYSYGNLGTAELGPQQARQRAEAEVLHNQAKQLSKEGNFRKSLEGFEQAWQLRVQALGRYHKETVESLSFSAADHFRLGNLERAEQLYWEALAASSALGLERSQDGLGTIQFLGDILARRADYEKAGAASRLVTEVTREQIELAAATQSVQRQLGTTTAWRFRLDCCLSIANRSKEFHQTAYEQLLAWKGQVLARQQEVRSASDQPELAPLFAELQRVAALLAQVTFSTPEESKVGEWRSRMQNLSLEKEKVESQISAKSVAFRQARSRTLVKDLAASLPDGYALVDCAEYWDQLEGRTVNQGGWWVRKLAAFVVRSNRPVQYVDLGPPSAIGTEIDMWRDFGRAGESAAAGQRLRQLVWEPLEQHLEGVHTVLVSPDGVLSRLPLAALPGREAGQFLLEERAFAIVPAPQMVSALVTDAGRKTLEAAANMLVLGGVDYDANVRDAAVEAPAEPKKQFGRLVAVRGDESLLFDSLPATSGELATIAQMYRDNYGDRGITTLRAASASETNVRREAPRHLYLHLATHGFFAPAKVRSALSGESGYQPGLLSGIALAGANKPQPDGDDGILTAAEVETMDLRRSELAVLSACETGLGEVAGGEGLLGLQRAFQVAGARTVIASLWKVDDVATRDLMERFYDNLWNKNMGKLTALREAQLWMLKERGARGLKEYAGDREQGTGNKRLPPYFWAAFVLSGDWR